MPDFGKVLKNEIARIAKREANSLLTAHIKTIRNLKREVAALKKQIGKPAVKQPTEPTAASSGKPEGKRARFTSKGITGMRKRLGLSRAQMATLCGVSATAVGLWESANTSKLNLRTKTREAMGKLRRMSPTAAKKVLAGK
jgi:DNA-binding transcriptional regulator YiaG